MKIVAKTTEGKEFLFNATSAHKVSERSADKIVKALNDVRYGLKTGEIWFVYDVDKYDKAYDYASFQSFVRRNHGLVEVGY